MTSIRSNVLAGSCWMKVLSPSSLRCDGLSLIQISTDDTPRRVMFPSTSTSTPGAFWRASEAVPVCTDGSSDTL